MSFFNYALILFLIMDSIGNISSYLSMVEGLPQARQSKIVIREMLIALGAMLTFAVIGESLFLFLDISEPTVRVASGVLLFLIAIKILFSSKSSLRANLPKEEPFVVPLAIPLIAGPSLLGMIMIFAHTDFPFWQLVLAIVAAWVASVIVLLFAKPLQRFLGPNGLNACERLTGMVLVMLSIQCFLEGIRQFVAVYCCKA